MYFRMWLIIQNVLQFQSRGTLAARLSAIPPFCPNTPPSGPLGRAQLTVGVEGSSAVELSLFDRLDRWTFQRLYSFEQCSHARS